MVPLSSNEHCLVCNSPLTGNGQCPTCDAFTTDRNAIVGLGAKKNKGTTTKIDFKAADTGKNRNSLTAAFLFNKDTKERFELSSLVTRIGRDSSNDICLHVDNTISRYHAWVFQNKGKFWVEDLGSVNGTLINGSPIAERAQLSAGDRITFGKTELIFVVE